MAEILWVDERSAKRKIVTLDVIENGEAVAEVRHLFDPKDGATIAGAVMEIGEGLKPGQKLARVDTTFGKVRQDFVKKIVASGVNTAC